MSIHLTYTEDGLVLYINDEKDLVIDITDEYLTNTFPDIDSTNRKPIIAIKNSSIKRINIDKEVSYITVNNCKVVCFYLESKRKHMMTISNSAISNLIMECDNSVYIILEYSNIKFIVDNLGFSISDLYIKYSNIEMLSAMYINMINSDNSYITKLASPFIEKCYIKNDSEIIGLNRTFRVSDKPYQYNADNIKYVVFDYILKHII